MSTLGAEDVDGSSATGQAAASTLQGSIKAKQHKGRRQMDDTFMMTMYKVKLCTRTTAHNWKLCPWAHPGETVVRRHPSCHMAEMCPAVRQHQHCPHGEGCLYSRNTFECWLHPSRYRTTMCSSGEGCTRNICFFAHNEQELRSPPSSDSAQAWSLMASALPQPGQPQVLPDTSFEQQQLQGVSNPGAVMASLAASSGMMVSPLAARCGSAGDALGAVGPVALSPGSSHSCPLPNSCLVAPGGAWHPTPAPGAPAVTTAPSAQQAQLQALLQHPQMQPMLQQQFYVGPVNGALLAGGVNGAGYASATHAVQGAVLGPTASQPPILSACGSAGVLCSMGQPQSMHLLGEGKQYSPAGSCYNISATAGMYAAGGLVPGGGGLVAAAVTAPLDASVCNMQGLQPNSCDSLAASDCTWQHQQLAMLLQRMQLSGGSTAGGALHFSSDSLSSYSLPPMSHSLLSDLSTESLASLLTGHHLTQELAVNNAAHLSGMTAQDLQLLPLEASGLIQLSALDETAVVADQRKQAVTLAMQQAGGRW